MPYISANQIITSFQNLESRISEGKTGIERTSGLLYFLAFDAVCREQGEDFLDMDPDKLIGRTMRKKMRMKFAELVMLGNYKGRTYQVVELGKVVMGGTDPEKRISSNFLTVPLKKATLSGTSDYPYPNRPAPILNLGRVSTGKEWGIGHHPDWRNNLPFFLMETASKTPFTDLAFFVFRYQIFEDPANTKYTIVLANLLQKKYTSGLAEFWSNRIKSEQSFARIVNPFSATQEPLPEKFASLASPEADNALYAHIEYLQDLLEKHSIPFKPYIKPTNHVDAPELFNQ